MSGWPVSRAGSSVMTRRSAGLLPLLDQTTKPIHRGAHVARDLAAGLETAAAELRGNGDVGFSRASSMPRERRQTKVGRLPLLPSHLRRGLVVTGPTNEACRSKS